ncbi:glutathione-dependent formaldehyde-activating [Cavenderia fasciculata]|uniref:Glutathione-dependent formaldehyde-activating n=1 Tax=Cavenderia fasciculata TaxID=261658 RepID=F4Q1E8_CACFS|nr:glutathione-dependent formaldehyde-activating [Cavenderia fasciculata]EGG18649.1 glutathione-dependent formaldehyde-activating [Cavenderia fasciculata]|eukprot:XP_004366553.1 glutathione-dependent formaldehyde-activating [Cavenderia fasciculata]
MGKEVEHHGGCHCGKVRYTVMAPTKNIYVVDCNCSICIKKGILHLIVPKSKFKVTGQENLSTYTFNTGIAKHYFCKFCGIGPYYIPRSNPDGIDVNVKTFDNYHPDLFIPEPYDGANWEKASESTSLSHLSKDDSSSPTTTNTTTTN